MSFWSKLTENKAITAIVAVAGIALGGLYVYFLLYPAPIGNPKAKRKKTAKKLKRAARLLLSPKKNQSSISRLKLQNSSNRSISTTSTLKMSRRFSLFLRSTSRPKPSLCRISSSNRGENASLRR